MEKNKEVIKKSYPDVYESKKIGVSKANLYKNSTHVPSRPEDSKNRLGYTSRTKNIVSVNKKSNIYSGETKNLFKHSCEQCGLKRSSNLIVNAVPVDHAVTERKLEHCHNLNGNIFNVHPTLCGLACPVPEISQINRVLNFPTTRHNDNPYSKCAKHKQKGVFSEQRGFNYKNTNSSNTFAGCKFSSPAANCNTRCHCSKNSSWSTSNVDPYFNISTSEAISESINASEEYNLKCGLKSSDSGKSKESISDLPILVHSNFCKDSWEVKYCIENKIKINNKQRKWNSKTWDQVATSSDRTVDSRSFDKTDKILFPALPSNSHSQVNLNSSHNSSMPPSEHSSADNSDLESVHSFPEGNVNCTSSFLISVSSTIPQASYADVIRMSSAGVQGLLAADFEKTSENLSHNTAINSLPEKLQKDENSQSGSSDWVISRLSQLDQNSSDTVHNISSAQTNQTEQNFGAPRPIVVSLEKPSFYNSSLQSNKNVLSIASHTNLTSPDKQVDENLIADCLCGANKISLDKVSLLSESIPAACISDIMSDTNVQGTSIKTDSVYSSPSSIDSFSDAFKPTESSILNACNYSKNKEPPVIIMNSSSCPQSMSEISFGIEYDEMIKLCSDSCDTPLKSVSSFSLHDADECCFSEENARSPEVNQESLKAHVQCEASNSATLVESLVAADQFISIQGKKIYWTSTAVDDKYNHQQVAEYLATGMYFLFI